MVTTMLTNTGADQISIRCQTVDSETYNPTGDLIEVKVALHDTLLNHPDNNVDLCAISIGAILQEAVNRKAPIYYSHITMDLIPDEDDWKYLDAIEEITMVGCPRGLIDEKNNLPIVRSRAIAL